MQAPLFQRTELRRIARVLGALLVLFGGVALIIQANFDDILPPIRGYVETTGMVIVRERMGTFNEPAFLITLTYDVMTENGGAREVRSGQRVEFEQYYALAEGDVVDLLYNQDDPSEWRVEGENTQLSESGLGILMCIFGILSLTFPRLINWASRQDDFEYTDEFEDSKPSGAKI